MKPTCQHISRLASAPVCAICGAPWVGEPKTETPPKPESANRPPNCTARQAEAVPAVPARPVSPLRVRRPLKNWRRPIRMMLTTPKPSRTPSPKTPRPPHHRHLCFPWMIAPSRPVGKP